MPRTCTSCVLAIGLATLALATSVALPAAPAGASETGPVCAGYDTVEISPGLSTEPSSGTINHVGPLGEENCYGGDPDGYKPTGPIRIEHYINYSGTCSDPVMKGYALHHIPTAEGVKTVRNDFTAGLFTGQGSKFSGAFVVRDLKGDCVTAPLTYARVDYWGHFHGDARD
jgi:hypothetical protein